MIDTIVTFFALPMGDAGTLGDAVLAAASLVGVVWWVVFHGNEEIDVTIATL